MKAASEKCGAGPAELVTSRWHLGLIYGRTTSRQTLLCRTHARSLVAGDLAKTAGEAGQ
jgi:hypothetical protein